MHLLLKYICKSYMDLYHAFFFSCYWVSIRLHNRQVLLEGEIQENNIYTSCGLTYTLVAMFILLVFGRYTNFTSVKYIPYWKILEKIHVSISSQYPPKTLHKYSISITKEWQIFWIYYIHSFMFLKHVYDMSFKNTIGITLLKSP